MLALVAAERSGGDNGKPVFFTVPWSPSIEERGGMPGSVLHWLMKFVALARSSPAEEVAPFLTLSDAALMMRAIFVAGYGLHEALALTKARAFIVELGLLGKAS